MFFFNPPKSEPKGPKIVEYKAKSFAVVGDCQAIAPDLQRIGGIYNENLTITGQKEPGWVFRKCKYAEVYELFPHLLIMPDDGDQD